MQTARDNKELRHKAELPLLMLSVTITMLALCAGLVLLIFPELPPALGLEASMDDITGVVALAPLAPLGLGFLRFYMAAQARANGVRVGPEQFPELYQLYSAVAEKIGMNSLPALYVVNGNGVVNAYALSCNTRRKYVVVHAEIAMLTKTRPQVVEFVLAHELGHHRLGHSSLWRSLVGVIPGFLVLPQKAAIRAQEYSADRVAASVCRECTQTIGLLAVGPFMEHDVNVDAYARQAEDEDKSWFVRMVHWMSDHAVNTKRLHALRQIEEHGLGSHGSMF